MFSSAYSHPSINAPRLVVITPPTSECVTLAEMKLHLRVDVDDDDALLTAYIKAARGVFEALTGRTLVATEYKAYWNHWPRVGTYAGAALSRELELPRAPLISLTSVKYLDDVDGTETVIGASTYTLAESKGDASRFPRLWLNDGVDAPTLGSFPDAVRANFIAGYGADASFVPDEIKAAVRLLVAHFYENRLPVNIGNIVNELPFGLQALIDLHQIRTLV